MNDTITLETVLKAKQILEENDAKDWDGRLYCYEWEAEKLLAGGVNPRHLVIIPSELPLSSQDKGTDR